LNRSTGTRRFPWVWVAAGAFVLVATGVWVFRTSLRERAFAPRLNDRPDTTRDFQPPFEKRTTNVIERRPSPQPVGLDPRTTQALQTIQDINRINRMNQEQRKRPSPLPTNPTPPKTKTE